MNSASVKRQLSLIGFVLLISLPFQLYGMYAKLFYEIANAGSKYGYKDIDYYGFIEMAKQHVRDSAKGELIESEIAEILGYT